MTTGTELWLFAVAVGASALGGMLGYFGWPAPGESQEGESDACETL